MRLPWGGLFCVLGFIVIYYAKVKGGYYEKAMDNSEPGQPAGGKVFC